MLVKLQSEILTNSPLLTNSKIRHLTMENHCIWVQMDAKSNGFARPDAHLLALLSHSLAPDCSLCSNTPLRLFAHMSLKWIRRFHTVTSCNLQPTVHYSGRSGRSHHCSHCWHRSHFHSYSNLIATINFFDLYPIPSAPVRERLFLDAPSHLYKRGCPSIGPSVRPSVRPSVHP